MLPVQSLDAQALRPGGPPGALPGADTAEVRQQKPKTLPCRYCSKRFRRVEHVQRHERTHTKEKPFACTWDRCGKTFGRRDLLVRHEKLVHLNESGKEAQRPRKLSSGTSTSTNGQPHRPSFSEAHMEADNIGLGRMQPQQTRPHMELNNHHHGLVQHQPQSQQQQQNQQFQVQQEQGHIVQQLQQQQQQQQQRRQELQQRMYNHSSAKPGLGPTAPPDSRIPRSAACNLDLLSDAALASEVNPMQPMLHDMSPPHPTHGRVKSYGESIGAFSEKSRDDTAGLATGFPPQPTQDTYDDYNLFLDDFTSSQHFLPPHFETDQQLGLWPRSSANGVQRWGSKPPSQFSSRIGSMVPDGRDGEGPPRGHEDNSRPAAMRISVMDHTLIKNRLDEFSAVLPKDFVFPSRHTLARFLEGYFSGFHEHLPFLHLPTLTPSETAPELLLAILSVGAQYRFESNRGYALWYAARAVAMEQIRRRHSSEVHALLPTPAAYSPHSTRPSPSMTYRHSFASAQNERQTTQDTHREPYSPNTPQARMETIQSVLLLFAVGLWGVKTILQEALGLQSTLANLIREDGLHAESSHAGVNDWEVWVRLEGAARTKLIAYCFFNLCSTAYNMPPLLLTSELRLYLPLRSRLWRAESAWHWQELRLSTPAAEITVHEAFSRLFGRSQQGLPTHLSSLGNYVLIHTLLQHIYLLKQTSIAGTSPFDAQRTLKPDDVEEVTQALRVWQTSFEHRHQLRQAETGQFGSGPDSTGGSLAYNASALLRLAYIRLYTEMSASRSLETRDSALVGSTLSNAPLLLRSPRLHRAVFQAVHALSMLVRAGVNYVARTKSAEWSIQHSLCNFECAILLAKWLLTLGTIGDSGPPASPEEKNLLETIRRMLDETEFAVPVDPSLSASTAAGGAAGQMEMATSDGAKLRQLAAAVVRLWAETFKGTHIFELVKVMGASMEGFADLVEKSRDRGGMGRMGEPSVSG
ncbi:hypothetical protein NLU13_9840 [Sarocladium strictum]|uniref:C2H2-type domain-containing protein n=1 Tax=Sarocladium strictum TaxID=5046 RepID=A0AA39L3N1_SARSR|nr:hypothetical protein NLU13_9840 [Sarocladium strictum]